MMHRAAALLLPLAAAAGAAGCVSAPEGAGAGAPRLEFPDVKYLVKSSVILHEVGLYFEMARPPLEDEEPMVRVDERSMARGSGERYTAGYEDQPLPSHHRFAFQDDKFLVGEFHYPAVRGARLMIFRPREGPFTFFFRGRKITVEREGRWKPALLYRQVQEKEELTPSAPPPAGRGRRSRVTRRQTITHLLEEAVQVGPSHIVAASQKDVFIVNGLEVPAPPGAVIVIDRRGAVRASR